MALTLPYSDIRLDYPDPCPRTQQYNRPIGPTVSHLNMGHGRRRYR